MLELGDNFCSDPTFDFVFDSFCGLAVSMHLKSWQRRVRFLSAFNEFDGFSQGLMKADVAFMKLNSLNANKN